MAICNLNKPEYFEKIEQKDFDYINSQEDFTGKVLAMMRVLHLTDEEIEERKFIQSEITSFLKPYYPYCSVIPFGSSINGFGFKGCDLDLLFLPFPEYCNLDFKDFADVQVPLPSHVFGNPILSKSLLTMNETCHLKFVRRIMYSKRYFFSKVAFIPAKCPILSIEFVESPISCDFSASNRLVLNNTELQWLYGTLDSRVKPIVMFLRYWAKSLGLIQKCLLSSYAFSLLVIFYLQNTEPPILPSVERLIELSDFSCKVDGWSTGFCKNVYRIPPNNNSASIEELLMGFFDFYWNFDFIHNVVSPHTARAIPIKDLLESDDERIKTFQVTPFSIQDPFVLSRNISRNAEMKTSFKLALLVAKRLMQKKDSFQKLFDFSECKDGVNKMIDPVLEDFHESFVTSHVYLSYEICCKLGITNELYLWHNKVCETVLDILQYGLLFECEVIDKVLRNEGTAPPPQKKRKCESNNIVKLELIMSIQCAAYYNTWYARKKALIDKTKPDGIKAEQCSDVLLKEHNLSLNLSQGCSTLQSPLVWFICNCYKYNSPQIPDVVLIFSPLTNMTVFSAMSSFLRAYVQKHVIKILSEEKSKN